MILRSKKPSLNMNGVGYGIYMPQQALSLLPPMGQQVKIHTYLNIREDAMQLFGFLTKEDLNVFRLLIGVNGIGPKAGLNILSCLSPDELRFAVLSGDAKAISATPGIGKKTAEKLIVELKDKLNIEDVLEHAAHGGDSLRTTGIRYGHCLPKTACRQKPSRPWYSSRLRQRGESPGG